MDRTLKIKKKLTVFFISVMLAITTVLPVAYMNGAFAASKVPSKVTISSVKANAYNKSNCQLEESIECDQLQCIL